MNGPNPFGVHWDKFVCSRSEMEKERFNDPPSEAQDPLFLEFFGSVQRPTLWLYRKSINLIVPEV